MTTNKELADRLRKLCLRPDVVQEVQEIADYIESLPDPTPEPVKDLRWLVGRHECLAKHLEYITHDYGPWSWDYRGDNTGGSVITGHAALTVVRGIVKGLCGPHYWDLSIDHRHKDKWYTNAKMGLFDTELEAIDALLTAMRTARTA